MNTKKFLSLALLLAAPLAANAQFTASSVTEAMTVAEIQTALGASSTTALEGIALGPGNTVYIIHDDAGALTLAQLDLTNKTAVWSKTEAQIITDLGLTGNLSLVGEFVFDPTNQRLVLASDIGASTIGEPWTVFEVSTVSPYTASVIFRSPTIQGWNSHDLTSTGVIVGALGEDYEILTGSEAKIVYLDETGPVTLVDLFDADEFKAVLDAADTLGPTDELPPETVGIDLTTDTIYIFGHDNFELLSIPGLTAVAPLDPEVTGWDDAATPTANRVDLHGLDVDSNSVVYGFDEAAEAIVIWDGIDAATDVTSSLAFADLKTTLGGTGDLEVTVWRGMKARALSTTQAEVFLAPANADQGLVRVVVDYPITTNVSQWDLY